MTNIELIYIGRCVPLFVGACCDFCTIAVPANSSRWPTQSLLWQSGCWQLYCRAINNGRWNVNDLSSKTGCKTLHTRGSDKWIPLRGAGTKSGGGFNMVRDRLCICMCRVKIDFIDQYNRNASTQKKSRAYNYHKGAGWIFDCILERGICITVWLFPSFMFVTLKTDRQMT